MIQYEPNPIGVQTDQILSVRIRIRIWIRIRNFADSDIQIWKFADTDMIYADLNTNMILISKADMYSDTDNYPDFLYNEYPIMQKTSHLLWDSDSPTLSLKSNFLFPPLRLL